MQNGFTVTLIFYQVDETTGRMTGQYKTYAICGDIRKMVCPCVFFFYLIHPCKNVPLNSCDMVDYSDLYL